MTKLIITLPIDRLNRSGGTQPRAQLNEEILAEYTEVWKRGGKFPAVDAVHDGKKYFLWNGFHRVTAAERAGVTKLDVSVTQGDLALAQWLSFSANKAHGLRRTNQELQAAVQNALQHPLAAGKSDRAIADHCGVDHQTVTNWRKKLESTGEVRQLKTRAGRDGRTRDTSNIGAANKARAQASPANGKSKIGQEVYQFLLHNHPRTTAEVFEHLVREGLAKRNEESQEYYVVSLLTKLEEDGTIESDWWEADKTTVILKNETSRQPRHPAGVEEAEERAPTPAPAALKDQLGRAVPERLQPVFDLLTEPIKAMRQKLMDAEKIWTAVESQVLSTEDLKWISGFSGFLDLHNMMDDVKSLVYRCRSALPYTLCSYCKATEQGCRVCHGTGVIVERTYESAPAEIRPEGSPTLTAINERDGIKSRA